MVAKLSRSLRKTYVSGMRGARAAARRAGLLERAEASDRQLVRWMRSLFAIWDIDDMVELDLAWWTFEAMSATDRFLAGRGDATVVEFGSGASTLWLAKRAAKVISIEHDDEWADVVAGKLVSVTNVDYRVIPPTATDRPTRYGSSKPGWEGFDFEKYVHGADDVTEPVDLAVVDGRCRAECFAQVLDRMADDAMVLFDNTGRRRYRDAITASDLPTIETSGLTACLPYRDRTTLVFKSVATRDALRHLLDEGHPGS